LKPVIVLELAQREIDAVASYYEGQRHGLGALFAERVAEALERIERASEGYQTVYRDLRRVNLRQFRDHALWFRTMPDLSIVVACLSSRRNPALAAERVARVINFPEP